MKEIMDVYNWACPEVPKKIYIKPRVQPSANFGGRDDQFGSSNSPKLTIDGKTIDWLKVVKSKSKPISSVEIEQGYKIAELERKIEHQKSTLIIYENRSQDYTKLEVDYLNSQGKVKELESKLELFEGLEQNHLWLMQQHLNLKKELGK